MTPAHRDNAVALTHTTICRINRQELTPMTTPRTDPEVSPAPPTEVALLHRQIDSAGRELSEFRDRVRAEVINQYESRTWCYAGSNDVLDDLDLPQIMLEYTGTVTITATVTVNNADSDSQARDWIANALDVTSTTSDVEVNDHYIDTSFPLDH